MLFRAGSSTLAWVHHWNHKHLDHLQTSDDSATPLTVSQLNRQVKSLLDSHFDFIWVAGEVSNFAAPTSGHWYFSLKDGNAQVRCAMFRNRNQRVHFLPANGDALRLRARVSLYEGRGEFQLIVEHLEQTGAGALLAAFEKLKTKLQSEGLFAGERKQPLPQSVARLAIVTSPTGAAVQDILQVLRRRCPAIEIFLLPVPVQGDSAAGRISAAIEAVNRWHNTGQIDLDAIIVGRGGGSLEDLWAFNEEAVARAIAASTLPVVSAVGHEVDFTIADMVADYRAPTPSAAAELLSPDHQEYQHRLRNRGEHLVRLMHRHLRNTDTQLGYLKRRLRHPGAQIRENQQRLDDLEQRLILGQRNLLRRCRDDLALKASRLGAHSPLPRLLHSAQVARQARQQLDSSLHHRLGTAAKRLNHLQKMLDSLSPLGVLQRGYAIVTTGQGTVLRASDQVAIGDEVNAKLASGRLKLTVNQAENEGSS
ncbi:MAG: exodeoxyribonuclease VII large subunit [Halioglobus sp.]|nr:exodeoxyribonuclease VII large subunit [Halioglobus sp.]